MDNTVELVVTVVVTVDGEQAARDACEDLAFRTDGRIVEVSDCSAEEPGCWAVTISLASDEHPTNSLAGALARAVRQFIRGLAPDAVLPRIACEPPTAWTVLEDPDVIDVMAPKAERLLIEAWYGDSPYSLGLGTGPDVPAPENPVRPPAATPPAATVPVPPVHRLTLRVDVATARFAGAEWQARAVASRISPTATLTGISQDDGVVSVRLDLGPAPGTPSGAVWAAVMAHLPGCCGAGKALSKCRSQRRCSPSHRRQGRA